MLNATVRSCFGDQGLRFTGGEMHGSILPALEKLTSFVR